jgi:hypothetical protein
MFAGRYLWWMLIGIAIYLFFSMCFDYFTWLTVALSGCTSVAGSCGPIIITMSGTLKPMGLWLAGAIMLFSILARIYHISLSPLWAVVVLVWFAASASFPMVLASGWTGQVPWPLVLESLPIAFLFLVSFCAYLLVAFEENGLRPLGEWWWLRLTVWASAFYGVLAGFAETQDVSAMLAKVLGLTTLAALAASLRPRLAWMVELGDSTPYLMLALFSVALVATLLPLWLHMYFNAFLTPKRSRR